MPRLENWSVITRTVNPFQAPELGFAALHGNVYDNPNFDDGDEVDTSVIKSIDLDKKVAQTRNTLYELGEPDAKWLEWLKENGYDLRQYHKPIPG